MSDKSLFAVLLRSSWWLSFAIALALALATRLIAPEEYFIPALSICLPFLVIGVMAAWKQLRVPSAGRVAATVEAVAAMSWRDFSEVMEKAFERDGYEVTRISGAADFSLVKAGRTMLVSCKRWKAANHGLEPLRELNHLRESQGGNEAFYVALGGVSENARRFAQNNRIRLIQGVELTSMLRLSKGQKTSV